MSSTASLTAGIAPKKRTLRQKVLADLLTISPRPFYVKLYCNVPRINYETDERIIAKLPTLPSEWKREVLEFEDTGDDDPTKGKLMVVTSPLLSGPSGMKSLCGVLDMCNSIPHVHSQGLQVYTAIGGGDAATAGVAELAKNVILFEPGLRYSLPRKGQSRVRRCRDGKHMKKMSMTEVVETIDKAENIPQLINLINPAKVTYFMNLRGLQPPEEEEAPCVEFNLLPSNLHYRTVQPWVALLLVLVDHSVSGTHFPPVVQKKYAAKLSAIPTDLSPVEYLHDLFNSLLKHGPLYRAMRHMIGGKIPSGGNGGIQTIKTQTGFAPKPKPFLRFRDESVVGRCQSVTPAASSHPHSSLRLSSTQSHRFSTSVGKEKSPKSTNSKAGKVQRMRRLVHRNTTMIEAMPAEPSLGLPNQPPLLRNLIPTVHPSQVHHPSASAPAGAFPTLQQYYAQEDPAALRHSMPQASQYRKEHAHQRYYTSTPPPRPQQVIYYNPYGNQVHPEAQQQYYHAEPQQQYYAAAPAAYHHPHHAYGTAQQYLHPQQTAPQGSWVEEQLDMVDELMAEDAHGSGNYWSLGEEDEEPPPPGYLNSAVMEL